MSGHARLAPSNRRWPKCPGSVREEARHPDISGDEAIDGLGSHLLLETCIKAGATDASEFDQQTLGAGHADKPDGWVIDKERIARVNVCLSYIERRKKELQYIYPGVTIEVIPESESNPGVIFGRDDWYGTCDVVILVRDSGDTRYAEVVDFKDGRDYVRVHDNTQLIAYLVAKFAEYKAPEHCRMTIVQPKTSPPIRYECSIEHPESGFCVQYIRDKARELHAAAIRTDDPDAPLVAGDHCHWCGATPKRGGDCSHALDDSGRVLSTHGGADWMSSLTNLLKDPDAVPSDKLAEILDIKASLLAVFDRCEAEVRQRLDAGGTVPGYRMAPGRSSRKWNEPEDEIVKKLKNKRLKLTDIYPQKLVTPAALLQSPSLTDTQRKKIEAELVTTIAGKMTLTKVAHKKPEHEKSADVMFSSAPKKIEPISFL